MSEKRVPLEVRDNAVAPIDPPSLNPVSPNPKLTTFPEVSQQVAALSKAVHELYRRPRIDSNSMRRHFDELERRFKAADEKLLDLENSTGETEVTEPTAGRYRFHDRWGSHDDLVIQKRSSSYWTTLLQIASTDSATSINFRRRTDGIAWDLSDDDTPDVTMPLTSANSYLNPNAGFMIRASTGLGFGYDSAGDGTPDTRLYYDTALAGGGWMLDPGSAASTGFALWLNNPNASSSSHLVLSKGTSTFVQFLMNNFSPESALGSALGSLYVNHANGKWYRKSTSAPTTTGWKEILDTSTGATLTWKTINTPSGTDPVPTILDDTLNFTGSNVTITGNSTTKTVNFAVTFPTPPPAYSTITGNSGSCSAAGSEDSFSITAVRGFTVDANDDAPDAVVIYPPAGSGDGQLFRWDNSLTRWNPTDHVVTTTSGSNKITLFNGLSTATATMILQFGGTSGETLTWNHTNGRFDLSDDLNVTGTGTYSSTLTVNGGLIASSTLDVTSTATFGGNLIANGNTTLGNATTDTITLTARFVSDLLPSTSGTRSLGSTSLRWVDIWCSAALTAGSANIGAGVFTANDTEVFAQLLNVGDAGIYSSAGDVIVGDNLSVTGNTTLGNATTDTITFTARAASSLLPSTNGLYNLGSSTHAWEDIYCTDVLTCGFARAGNGTNATPSFSFTTDTDTGLYRVAANTLGIVAGGADRLYVSDTYTYLWRTLMHHLDPQQLVRVGMGTLAAVTPEYDIDTDDIVFQRSLNGAEFWQGSGSIVTIQNSSDFDAGDSTVLLTLKNVWGGKNAWTAPTGHFLACYNTSATMIAHIDYNGRYFGPYFIAESGSAGSPGFAVGTGANNGMYSAGTNALGFSTAGTNRLTISASGDSTFTGSVDATQYKVNGGDGVSTSFYFFDAGGNKMEMFIEGGIVRAVNPA